MSLFLGSLSGLLFGDDETELKATEASGSPRITEREKEVERYQSYADIMRQKVTDLKARIEEQNMSKLQQRADRAEMEAIMKRMRRNLSRLRDERKVEEMRRSMMEQEAKQQVAHLEICEAYNSVMARVLDEGGRSVIKVANQLGGFMRTFDPITGKPFRSEEINIAKGVSILPQYFIIRILSNPEDTISFPKDMPVDEVVPEYILNTVLAHAKPGGKLEFNADNVHKMRVTNSLNGVTIVGSTACIEGKGYQAVATSGIIHTAKTTCRFSEASGYFAHARVAICPRTQTLAISIDGTSKVVIQPIDGSTPHVIDGTKANRWSPSGAFAVVCDIEGTKAQKLHVYSVKAWGVESSKTFTFEMEDAPQTLMWSPDDTQVALFGGQELAIFDITASEEALAPVITIPIEKLTTWISWEPTLLARVERERDEALAIVESLKIQLKEQIEAGVAKKSQESFNALQRELELANQRLEECQQDMMKCDDAQQKLNECQKDLANCSAVIDEKDQGKHTTLQSAVERKVSVATVRADFESQLKECETTHIECLDSIERINNVIKLFEPGDYDDEKDLFDAFQSIRDDTGKLIQRLKDARQELRDTNNAILSLSWIPKRRSVYVYFEFYDDDSGEYRRFDEPLNVPLRDGMITQEAILKEVCNKFTYNPGDKQECLLMTEVYYKGAPISVIPAEEYYNEILTLKQRKD